MTPQELRKSIIQLALKGELSEHSCHQSVDELLSNINEKRKELIKNGLTKKAISSSFDEVPYEIPDSWKWVRLSDIGYVNGGYAFKSSDYKEQGIRIVRISDFNESGFINTKIVRQDYKEEFKPFLLSNNDILLCMTGGTVGKSYYVENMNEPMVTNQRVATIKILNPCKKYVNFAILSPLVQKSIQDSKNSTNDNISMDLINDFPIPLPPLEEQEKIVAKIEELLPLVKRYEEAWNKLEKFNRKFPSEMEKSILNYALEGKLVQQLSSEGDTNDVLKILIERINANRKPKNKIAVEDVPDDEIPFEIPSSWKWCRIADVCNIVNGFTPSRTNELFWENGDICWMTVDDINEQGKYLTRTNQHITRAAIKSDDRIVPPNSTFLCCTSATIGRVAINKVPMASNQQFNGIIIREEFKDLLCNDYVYLYCSTLKSTLLEIAGITTFPFVSVSKLGNLPFPLPPYDEQKRIVEKIEELLPLCRKLIK